MTSFVTKEKYAQMKAKYEERKLSVEEDSTQTENICVDIVVDRDDYLLPENLDNETKARYTEIMESIRESSKYARGALLNERGQILWEEPLDEYEKRMEGLE